MVADEGTVGPPGRALAVQHHVDPRGGAVDLAELGVVVTLLGADDLGDRAQHRDVAGPRVAAQGRPAPKPHEPRQKRVLHDQLGATLDELLLEPLVQPAAHRLEVVDLAGLEPRRGAGVGDRDVGAAQQLVVEVDHPLRLTEALGVGLVGVHLRLRHVHAQRLEGAGERARAAAAGADDEDDATARGGLEELSRSRGGAGGIDHARQRNESAGRVGAHRRRRPPAACGDPQPTDGLWDAISSASQWKDSLGVRRWVTGSTCTRPKRWA